MTISMDQAAVARSRLGLLWTRPLGTMEALSRALREGPWIPSFWKLPALIVLAFGLLCLRAWPRLVDPQVWDEDGTQNLVGFLLHGWSSLAQPVNGYLITVPKLVTMVSASISLRWYPEVSTAIAWMLTVAILVLIARAPLHLRGAAWLIVTCALVPANPEVFGLPLYTFWWSAVLLVALTCWNEEDRAWRLRACLLAICSISSPVCFVTLPLFLTRAAMFRRHASEQRLATVAVFCSAVQLGAMWPLAPGSLSASAVSQLLPVFVGSFLVGNIVPEWNFAAALLVIFVGAAALQRNQERWEIGFLAYLVGALALLSASRVDVAVVHQSHSGPRYFFLPYVVIGWLLLQVVLSARQKLLRWIATGLLLLSALNAVPVLTREHDHLDWAGSLRSCSDFATFEMPVHYDGDGWRAWTAPLRGSECAAAMPAKSTMSGATSAPVAFRTIRFTADTIGLVCYRPPRAPAVLADGWRGVDRAALIGHPSLPADARVIGSMRESSVDKGALVVRMARGDRIMYRTGPRPERQTIEILGAGSLFRAESLATDDWVLLEFSSKRLPDTFDVRFTDNGDALGEWSAVAMRSR